MSVASQPTSTSGIAAAPTRPAEHVSTFRVRYSETDQMGVVHHRHYLVWCELGRTDLIRALGKSYADIEAEGVFLAVAEASLRYHAAARYEEEIQVTTRVEQVRTRAITFAYEIARLGAGGPARLATARTTLVPIDRAGRSRALPPDLLSLFRNAAPPAPA
jgi:acyl-CoA thioester hydrolase